MKVQIYLGPSDVKDALMCVNAGADLIGFAADKKLLNDVQYTGGGLPSFNQVGDVFSALPDSIEKVALTFETDIVEIMNMVKIVKPTIIHLAGKTALSPQKIQILKSCLKGIKVMQAVAVNQPDPIGFSIRYSTVCDYFLLDSNGDDVAHPYGIGATGNCHDWSISAAIVRRVNTPVILAGGLSPDNVKDAIEKVRPWGVDSFTLTNIEPKQNSKKDKIKVEKFINNAKKEKLVSQVI